MAAEAGSRQETGSGYTSGLCRRSTETARIWYASSMIAHGQVGPARTVAHLCAVPPILRRSSGCSRSSVSNWASLASVPFSSPS
jgi:hypothetical protein